MSRLPFILALPALLAHGSAFALVDQSWNEPNDGGGRLPGFALLVGLAGALWLGGRTLKEGGSLNNTALAAWLGFVFGAMVGLPISCILQ